MNIGGNRSRVRAFTISEVTLAVGIIAFGLVAIFSILPFGLSAQRDNRDETLIRYEADYWFSVLQSGVLPLESLDRVETVQVLDSNRTTFRIDRYRLDAAQQTTWAPDVCGWLSAPDARVPGKFARVRSINASMFDRLYSARGQNDFFLPGGDLTFNYILQTKVEPHGNAGTRLTLIFHWPITGSIEDQINSGKTYANLISGPQNPFANSKEFSILTTKRPRPALTFANLDARQNQLMHAGLAGDEVTVAQLQAMFPDRYSSTTWDGYLRGLLLNAQGQVKVMVFNPNDGANGTWRQREEFVGSPLDREIREMLHLADVGQFLQVSGQSVAYPIASVHVNGHYAMLAGSAFTPVATYTNFKISFLAPNENWKDLLSSYQRAGLLEPAGAMGERFRFNRLHKSTTLGGLTNAAGSAFRVTLDPADYWPADPPSTNRVCSFWYLK